MKMRSNAISAMTAIIGVKSIGPAEIGMTRRQNRRYGLADVAEEPLHGP